MFGFLTIFKKYIIIYKNLYFNTKNMVIKKINLSALNKQSWEETINNDTILNTDENISKSEDRKNTNESIEIEKIQEVSSKKKISLKSLKKCVITPEWEEICEDSEATKEIKNQLSNEIANQEVQNKQPKISLKKPILSAPEEKVEEKTQEIVSEETKSEEVKEEKSEVFQISDGDTSCNIIKEEKSEIFANYKWSFSHSEEEVKNEVIKEITEEKSEIKEIVEVKNEAKAEIVDDEEPQKIQEIKEKKSTKTNLERYSESEKISKKAKQKKLITWSILWLLALSTSWFFATQNLFIKSNINEVSKVWVEVSTEKNIEQKNEIEVKKDFKIEQIPTNTPEITTEATVDINKEKTNTPEIIVMPEIVNDFETQDNINNQIVNNDIVKENNENQFDNIEKSTKINQKLHNYLREKYKK